VLAFVSGCGGGSSTSSTGSGGTGGGNEPEAAFSAQNNVGDAPLDVAFTDLSTGDVTGWTWTFGDGGTSSQQNPSHVYGAVGVYSVTLRVQGPGGSSSLTTPDLVHVTDGGGGTELQALFGAQNNVGDAPLQVTFTDLSTGAVTAWQWTFGDGSSSTQRNPSHTYGQPGAYDVSLTVHAGADSDRAEKPGFVRVLDPDAHGIWTGSSELASLPTSGSAWNNLLSAANSSAGTPDVSNQDDDTDVIVLAKALVFARTGEARYRDQVVAACDAAIGTERGGRTLALGRNLLPYVVSADLVGLPTDVDTRFRAWLRECLTETLDGRTLVATHEERPNNWGTHAGASRIAAALYLGDTAEVERAARVFHGWLGDRSAYSAFEYGELDWQANANAPVGINPRSATHDGHSIDGVLPDDQRRAGGFTWPPPKENYVWEALQGAVAQAVLLHRAGYDTWNWSDQALLRAARWLHEQCNFPASGDDTWIPHLLNHFYGENFPAPSPSSPGKNMGWTDWTHG